MIEREYLAIVILMVMMFAVVLTALNIGRGTSYLLALIVELFIMLVAVAMIVNPAIVDILVSTVLPSKISINILHLVPNTSKVRFADEINYVYKLIKPSGKLTKIFYKFRNVEVYGGKTRFIPGEALMIANVSGGFIATKFARLVIPASYVQRLATADKPEQKWTIFSTIINAIHQITLQSSYGRQVAFVLVPRRVTDISHWIERFYAYLKRKSSGQRSELELLLQRYLQENASLVNVTAIVMIISAFGRTVQDARRKTEDIYKTIASSLEAQFNIKVAQLPATEVFSVINLVLGRPPVFDQEMMSVFRASVEDNILKF